MTIKATSQLPNVVLLLPGEPGARAAAAREWVLLLQADERRLSAPTRARSARAPTRARSASADKSRLSAPPITALGVCGGGTITISPVACASYTDAATPRPSRPRRVRRRHDQRKTDETRREARVQRESNETRREARVQRESNETPPLRLRARRVRATTRYVQHARATRSRLSASGRGACVQHTLRTDARATRSLLFASGRDACVQQPATYNTRVRREAASPPPGAARACSVGSITL